MQMSRAEAGLRAGGGGQRVRQSPTLLFHALMHFADVHEAHEVVYRGTNHKRT